MPRLHVRNVPASITVDDLRALLEELEIPGEVHFAREPGSARYAGKAYIACATESAAADAQSKLHGYTLGDTQLEVEIIDESAFFDEDGLFADGAAPMGRQDGSDLDEG